jgi:symplekin
VRLLAVPAAPVATEDINGDFDDYDPEAIPLDFHPHTTTADDEEGEGAQIHPDLDSLALSSFELPHPERLSPTRLKSEFQASVERILHSLRSLEVSSVQRAGLPTGKAPGLGSLAIAEWDKEAWMVLLTRLSARALSGPSRGDEGPLPNLLRERVFEYIMSNFREHMDLIIAWLTEEWYNDKLTFQELSGNKGEVVYAKWAMRILDNILPFIEMKDSKIFLRFLGDLPLLMGGMVTKLGVLCLDPERIKLGFAGIKYLLLLRPPVRTDCINLLVDLYKNRTTPRPLSYIFLGDC